MSVEDLHISRHTHHSLALGVVSPGLVVSNDTIQLLRVLVLGPWLLAVGLATASGAMIFDFAKVPLTVAVRRQAAKMMFSSTHFVIPQNPHLRVAVVLAD
jgi:hypothetical protein